MSASYLVVVDGQTPAHLRAAHELIGEIALTRPAPAPDGSPRGGGTERPADYCAPGAVLLLAYAGDALAGVGALRPCPEADYPNACQIRHLYVRPAMRRLGLGRSLAQELISRAREAGYTSALLDIPSETEAVRGLYTDLGFERVEPPRFSLVVGTSFFKVDLDAAAARVTRY